MVVALLRSRPYPARVGQQLAPGHPVYCEEISARERALAATAVIQAEIGDINGAREAFAAIAAQDVGDVAAQDLAAIFASQDRPTEAQEMLWNIVDPDQRAKAAVDVAQLITSRS